MSNQNPNDPNNLTLKGSKPGSGKPDFSGTSIGSSTRQGGAGGGTADFSNVTIGSSTHQGGASTGQTSYTVKSGDTLSGIAKQHLGDGNKWRAIYDANRQVIGDDPDLIKPGQQLVIPAAGGQ